MAFQKKVGSAQKNKNTKAPFTKGKEKKAFGISKFDDDDDDDDDLDDMDDSDFDMEGSSDDDGPQPNKSLSKTPKQKQTPKGKQTPKAKETPNDKRVSFQIPGQNKSLNKTPKSTLQDRQATPASKGMQEFKGMKSIMNNSGSKKNAREEEDDEDDEDDDDDDDSEEAGGDMSILEAGDDDSLDEEDEDDDDDDEDDDEEEEEDDAAIIKKIHQLKQKNQKNSIEQPNKKAKEVKRPMENAKKQSPQKSSPQKDAKESQASKEKPKLSVAASQDQVRKDERDARTLFIKGLPPDITVVELKALSPDILDVSIPKSKFPLKNKKIKTVFGFLEFANEAKAEENYITLQNKKVRGVAVLIDYSGAKSKNKAISGMRVAQENKVYNKRKLYISGIPVDATIVQVAKLFPKSFQITLNTSREFRSATALFPSEDEAEEAFNANRKATISGKAITVLYSLEKKDKKKKKPKRKSPFSKSGPPAKMLKMEPKEEEDDDDDDDDDDEDEDEE